MLTGYYRVLIGKFHYVKIFSFLNFLVIVGVQGDYDFML